MQVSKGSTPTLTLLGQLERIILWQLAAEEWKQARAKAAAKAAREFPAVLMYFCCFNMVQSCMCDPGQSCIALCHHFADMIQAYVDRMTVLQIHERDRVLPSCWSQRLPVVVGTCTTLKCADWECYCGFYSLPGNEQDCQGALHVAPGLTHLPFFAQSNRHQLQGKGVQWPHRKLPLKMMRMMTCRLWWIQQNSLFWGTPWMGQMLQTFKAMANLNPPTGG